jgi:hypothetical protein
MSTSAPEVLAARGVKGQFEIDSGLTLKFSITKAKLCTMIASHVEASRQEHGGFRNLLEIANGLTGDVRSECRVRVRPTAIV